MVEAAIDGVERLEVSRLELDREGPTYTIDTVRTLHDEAAERELFLIVGSDVAASIETWHRVDELRAARHARDRRPGGCRALDPAAGLALCPGPHAPPGRLVDRSAPAHRGGRVGRLPRPAPGGAGAAGTRSLHWSVMTRPRATIPERRRRREGWGVLLVDRAGRDLWPARGALRHPPTVGEAVRVHRHLDVGPIRRPAEDSVTEAEPTTSTERARIAARAADDKKGEDIVVLDVAEIMGIVDAFVITHASNTRLVRAIVDEVKKQLLERAGVKPRSVEGIDDMTWVLLDYGDLIVHVFLERDARVLRARAPVVRRGAHRLGRGHGRGSRLVPRGWHVRSCSHRSPWSSARSWPRPAGALQPRVVVADQIRRAPPTPLTPPVHVVGRTTVVPIHACSSSAIPGRELRYPYRFDRAPARRCALP